MFNPAESARIFNGSQVSLDAETPWATKIKAVVGCMHTDGCVHWKDVAYGLAAFQQLRPFFLFPHSVLTTRATYRCNKLTPI